MPPSLRRLTAIAALNLLAFACGQGVWRDPLAASLDARSARDVESTVDVPVVIESDALLEDSGTPDAAGITAPDQGPDTIECRAECVGGQSCQNGECVCSDGKVFVAGRCVFQCAACKTSNHCSGDRTAVMRETCDSETGRCTTEAVYRCEEGETCDGGTSRCACSGVFCVRENACKPPRGGCVVFVDEFDPVCRRNGCEENMGCAGAKQFVPARTLEEARRACEGQWAGLQRSACQPGITLSRVVELYRLDSWASDARRESSYTCP